MTGGRLADRPAAHVAALAVLAEARWPRPDGPAAPPPVAGFVSSSFAALVTEVAERCLAQVHGSAPVPAARGDRTAVLVVSTGGDQQTALAVAAAVDTGRRLSPLLFFQSVPNSVAGRIAAVWGLGGPLVCTSPTGDPTGDALALAGLLIDDGDADEVLAVLVEQGPDGTTPGSDHAVALLLTSDGVGPADHIHSEEEAR